ncbi:hypothetical protein DPMN_080820 [Dreissena polymorpha]|uniref:Uncharacterized protein n=1 Tax=Dreissena polymorpha TaxID=45954 RepID=A0A9D3YRK4_DREPO|nr:hypothetical protein DPMN_080820 [Dreissena polymorpha]
MRSALSRMFHEKFRRTQPTCPVLRMSAPMRERWYCLLTNPERFRKHSLRIRLVLPSRL